ncbi:MAG: phosphoenolpyruvate--protein phosphotransferase [Gemmatimonadota bacterium]|nr:MAG: phosphoenolpyruvate--protein phosphotransferase [Gemmatimonadota bacterium]
MNSNKRRRSRNLKCSNPEVSILKGIPASPGIAIGHAHILDLERMSVKEIDIEESRVEVEVKRFEKAVAKTKKDFASIQRKIANQLGEEKARIFDAHLLMLEDTMAIDETVDRIKKQKKNAEFIFFQNLENVRKTLLDTGDEYLRERAVDLQDVERRVLRNLAGDGQESFDRPEGQSIVLAKFLTPSDTAQLDRNKVLGFVTDLGGRTSHAAIMARSLEIPAVVGLKEVTQKVCPGDLLVIDGVHGIVIVNPDERTLLEYEEKQKLFIEHDLELLSLRDEPAATLDGRSIELQANIELPDEVETALSHGARGIGLFRTEYLYLARSDLPSESEQYEAYASVAERMNPDPVVIRTLDLGGDKFVSGLNIAPEPNPYLGWRAIRICLERKDIFKMQLRAILKASIHGNIRIMFPMISGLGELQEVKKFYYEVQQELREDGIPFNEDCHIGVMIEVPAAALVARELSQEVDFFSIGTNDLIQYTIAVDRGNEKIAYLFNHFHPAVLKFIQMIITAGKERGIWTGLCGEMAGDPLCVWLLLGMGLDEFSMSPIALPEAKRLIRTITYKEALEIANEALSFTKAKDVEDFLRKQLHERLGEIPL